VTGAVAVVTDSTACLDGDVATSCGIHVVPLRVVIGAGSHDDTSHAGMDVLAAQRDGVPLTTSRPPPARFSEVYARAAAAGAAGIVSIHLSGRISGTVDSARLAAAGAPVPATVVDSRSIGAGLGLTVLAAATAARVGLSLSEVAGAAVRRSAHLRSVFCLTTLDHLLRGGRMSAVTLLGATLGVKPLLHIVDGRIVPLEKVRTMARAVTRLERLAVEFAAGCDTAPVDAVVQHLACGDRAAELAQRLSGRMPGLGSVRIIEVGPVIAAHTGPGLLGVAVAAA